MKTWKKFLPNTKIVFLDYKNIGEFLDLSEFGSKNFPGRLNRSQIADAIRVALLVKYGGVCLDCDTIILNSNAEKYFLPDEDHKTVFFGYPPGRSCRISFINSPPGATCMELWLQSIKEKIFNLTPSTKLTWDFLGNTFINPYAKEHINEIEVIDDNLVTPEKKLISASNSWKQAYVDYYFFQNLHLSDVNNDMFHLHNSWTPPFFRQLSSLEEMLRYDCTMTNVLAEALEIKLPPPPERQRITLTDKK